MEKEIYLATGLYDSNKVILADNENLRIKIVGRIMPNLTYYIKARNGDNFFTKRFIDNFIEFARKDLVYGKFQAKIVAMANENVVKEFQIEDLVLIQVDEKLKVIPEFENLKDEFDRVKSENKQLKAKVAELEELCENTKNLVVELNGLTEKAGV